MRSLNKNSSDACSLYSVFLFKLLLLVMPICLFLSYHPVIKLGESESMYFELSVAEIWLVLFDLVGLVTLIRKRMLFRNCRKWWVVMLLPLWITLSVVWSLNRTRGLLTAGMLWCVVMAVYAIWTLRDELDVRFRVRWWKWFMGSTLVVCAWCVVQCVLDLTGASQSCSLLCDGCTYRMFGFPHPNGFAIEPQFMGNLLLAPVFASVWLWLAKKHIKRKQEREYSRDSHFYNGSGGFALIFQYQILIRDRCKNDNGSYSLCSCFPLICFFATATTLFLTFSRGAIYAFVVGMLFMSGYVVAKERKKTRGVIWKRVGVAWALVVGAFVVSLVAQGVMAEVSPTTDTFGDGVAKVVNHLSLGIIDVKGADKTEVEPVENPVEKFEDKSTNDSKNDSKNDSGDDSKEEAVFSGYVAESTDTRVRLTGAAVKVWSSDIKTVVLGVGIGGAGQALYNNGLSPAPREIVQNEYASLLLETGLVGVILAVVFVVLVIRWMIKSRCELGLVFSLLVAFGVSLMFFSGLPNALHVYLMPVTLMALIGVKGTAAARG